MNADVQTLSKPLLRGPDHLSRSSPRQKTRSVSSTLRPRGATAERPAFQQIDIEDYNEPKLGPTLRLFGVTADGNSVLAHVHGFRPYFFVAAPSGFLNKDLDSLKDTINVSLLLWHSVIRPDRQGIVGMTAVAGCTIFNRKSLWGYRGDEQVPFIKITCTDPKAMPKVRDKSSL